MRDVQGLTLSEWSEALQSRTRALASVRWLHSQGGPPTAFPTRVPGVAREPWIAFTNIHSLAAISVAQKSEAADGTTKYAVTFGDGAIAETVRIPSERRVTVCISSQSGCTRRCAFCATKDLGFTRNLTAAEMVAQYQLASGAHQASNVVFMGMGEPFDNLDAVLRAVRILTQAPAPQLKHRSITVSTSGVLPGLVRFLRECDASLALSLNATTDATRVKLMPQTRTWPIGALLGALRDDAVRRSGGRVYLIEYVLLAGVNDYDDDVTRLVQLLASLPVRVNLIPWNAYQAGRFLAPSRERVLQFHARASAQGLRCLVRWPRGTSIAAACGQLGAALPR